VVNKQQQQTLVLVILLLGGGGYFYWTKLFGPLLTTISERQATLNKKKKDWEEAKQKEFQLKKLRQEAARFEERLFLTYRRLPVKEQPHRLITLLQGAEKFSKVILTPVQPQAEVDRGTYIEVPIKLAVTGSFDQIGAFLNYLHGRDRLLAVTDIQFTGTGQTAPDPTVKAEVMVSAFRSKGEEPKWSRAMSVTSSLTPAVTYEGGRKDPFTALSPQDLAELQSTVNLDRLECTGVFKFLRSRVAQFQDPLSRAQYVLRDGRLYQITASGEKTLPHVRGTIQANRVWLTQQGTQAGERYQKSYPIPNP